MSASETAKEIKMKAQMDQQIQALEEQINLEKSASNRPQQLLKTLRYNDYSTFLLYSHSMPLNDQWDG